MQWIIAEFGVLRALELRDRSLNLFQNISGFLLPKNLWFHCLNTCKGNFVSSMVLSRIPQ